MAASPIILDNKKTRWFSNGLMSDYELATGVMREHNIHPLAIPAHRQMLEIFPIKGFQLPEWPCKNERLHRIALL